MKRTRPRSISPKRCRELRAFNKACPPVGDRFIPRQARISPECTGRATDRHHVKKQSQCGPDTRDNILYTCNPCNLWIEDHPDEARAAGLVESNYQQIEPSSMMEVRK